MTASGIVTLTVSSDALDAVTARRLLLEVDAAFAAGTLMVVVDLSGVTFIDSLGVSALVAMSRAAPPFGRVVLASLGGYAQTLARVTHLHEIFPIYATAEIATAALGAG